VKHGKVCSVARDHEQLSRVVRRLDPLRGRAEDAFHGNPEDELSVDPAAWFHARIEVATHEVRVFVDGAQKPCLVVERLRRPEKGGIGLWVDSHEGWFAGMKVSPTR
jgi:hypothetical protein